MLNKSYTIRISLIVALGAFFLGFDNAVIYGAALAISSGPVMWTLISEIFPNAIKGIAISVIGVFNSLVSFSVTQVFPWELSNLRSTVTFIIYSALSFCAIIYVYKYVIETKGKTLEELEMLLVKAV